MIKKETDNNKKNPEQNNPKNNKPKFNSYWIWGFIILALFGVQLLFSGSKAKKTEWHTFEQEMLKSGDVDRIVVVNDEIAEVYIKNDRLSNSKYKDIVEGPMGALNTTGPHYYFRTGPIESFIEQLNEAQSSLEKDERVPVVYEKRRDFFSDIFQWIFFPLLLIIIWIFIFRRMAGGGSGGSAGNIFNVGKSKAKIFDKDTNVKVNFNDVAGLEEAKVEVKEIVDFLKKPKKYTELGGKIPKGALLVGPPGTGKTLLAKAVAGEANVPFFSMSGSDFVEMFVGVGASRVRDLFKQAKEKAPCIVFIDEIDAVGRARGRNPNFGANDERENTLNQLLTEMDGFASNLGVIILAATNRADVLDKALLRAGRFDRQIHVELPDLNERKDIFKVHLRPIRFEKNIDVEFLARQTPGFSGADIANVCNEAALIAARKNKKQVEKQDFLDAVDRIIGGLEKKNKLISPEEKQTIAYHESGHAAISWLLEYASPLVKVTIVPRGKALGAAWYLPEERQITTTEQMLDEICYALGGRVAEEVVFGKISTGAMNDLEKVTKMAYAMVSYFGMSKAIGNISFYDSTGQSEYSFGKPYSEKTAESIDQEANKIIEDQYVRAKKILLENKEKLEQLALILLEKEVIFSEDVEKIFGKRKWGTPDNTKKNKVIRKKTTRTKRVAGKAKAKNVPVDGETPEKAGMESKVIVENEEEKVGETKTNE